MPFGMFHLNEKTSPKTFSINLSPHIFICIAFIILKIIDLSYFLITFCIGNGVFEVPKVQNLSYLDLKLALMLECVVHYSHSIIIFLEVGLQFLYMLNLILFPRFWGMIMNCPYLFLSLN